MSRIDRNNGKTAVACFALPALCSAYGRHLASVAGRGERQSCRSDRSDHPCLPGTSAAFDAFARSNPDTIGKVLSVAVGYFHCYKTYNSSSNAR